MSVEEMVASRYRLVVSLGSGGMGRVWEAEDTVLQRTVAIKAVELPDLLRDDERAALRERVLREARAAARIQSPHCVRVFDVVDVGDRVYLVLELVRAPTLADVVERDGPLSPEHAAAVGLALIDALAAAHEVGIVHRDVKPHNVMVLPAAIGPAATGGGVKLADFGVASIKDDPRITTTGLVLGTPSYMSPEQARGEHPGSATDVWALGATLYYAVEGVAPYDRGKALPTLNAVVHEEHRPTVRAGALAPVLHALLTKAEAARPTLDEARDMLGAVLRPVGAPATALPPDITQLLPAARSEPPEVVSAPSPPRPPSSAISHRGRAAGAVAAIGAVVIGALLLVRSGDDGDQRAASTAPADAAPATTEPATTPTTSASASASSTTSTPSTGAPSTTSTAPVVEVSAPIVAVPSTPTTFAIEALPDEPFPQAADDPTPVVPATPAPDEPEDDGERPEGVPTSWVTYTDDRSGYRIWHPPDWVPRAGRGPNSTDFRAADGDYLRVDYTTEPGTDPVDGLDRYEPTFAARVQGYARIALDAERFQGLPAGRLEYRYTGQRATNLWFVNEVYGFALNFQTSEGRWDERAEIREAFEAGFRLPPG